MDSLENKNIAEKLAGLDTLPPGYEPNLGSKWDLLEASRQGDRLSKRRTGLWLRAAAACLLVSAFAFLFFYETKHNTVPGLQQSPLKAVRSVKPLQPDLPEVKIDPQRIHNKRNTNRPLSAKPLTSEAQAEKVQVDTTHTVDSENNAPETFQKLALESGQLKKRKSRYVQMDFGAPGQQTKQGAGYYSNTKFKMFNGCKETPQNNGHTSSTPSHISINF